MAGTGTDGWRLTGTVAKATTTIYSVYLWDETPENLASFESWRRTQGGPGATFDQWAKAGRDAGLDMTCDLLQRRAPTPGGARSRSSRARSPTWPRPCA